MTHLSANQICIQFKKDSKYPDATQYFRPDQCYPEYLFPEDISTRKNDAYEMLRDCLYLRGCDAENFGKREWNPLKDVVQPGNHVLIKPNFVMDVNSLPGAGTVCLYTQPALIAAVIDYILIAQQGNGTITIGDAPMQECRFDRLVEKSGLDKLIYFYQQKSISIRLVDFRGLKSTVKMGIHHSEISETVDGTIIDLKENSEFSDYSKEHLMRMRVTNYDPRILQNHHDIGKHEYYIANDVLLADVIINMPKPKTHRKAGVTIAMKNMVGINVRKEFLPHHTVGEKNGKSQGDEYFKVNFLKRVRAFFIDQMNCLMADGHHMTSKMLYCIIRALSLLTRFSSEHYQEGSWFGNETISKTITDLNKILLYADKKGVMQDIPQRKYLIVADMIVSGEGEGPVKPSPKPVGVVAIGENPVVFDELIATLMGADIKQIPTLQTARGMLAKYALVPSNMEGTLKSNNQNWDGKTVQTLRNEDLLHFTPTKDWRIVFSRVKS